MQENDWLTAPPDDLEMEQPIVKMNCAHTRHRTYTDFTSDGLKPALPLFAGAAVGITLLGLRHRHDEAKNAPLAGFALDPHLAAV